MCPMGCGTVIKSENHLRGHLKEAHATPIEKKIKQFPSMGSEYATLVGCPSIWLRLSDSAFVRNGCRLPH